MDVLGSDTNVAAANVALTEKQHLGLCESQYSYGGRSD